MVEQYTAIKPPAPSGSLVLGSTATAAVLRLISLDTKRKRDGAVLMHCVMTESRFGGGKEARVVRSIGIRGE